MNTISRLPAVFLLGSALFFAVLAVPVFAQEESELDTSMQAALSDLSELYGSPVVRIDQARAICNQEQYMVECAAIGKTHGLFGKERQKEVDSILTKMKGRVVEELKQCGSTECLLTVATKIAKDLSASNPTLARTVEMTPQDVQDKRSIIEVSMEVGVDFEQCRTMDPDTASVELLRGCAKLAKHERMQEYIPEEHRVEVEKSEKTAELKEALATGQIKCGDGTLDGCGTFCLNPTAAEREDGRVAIPSICRQIAEQFFGPEGVSELERTYSTVQRTYDEVRDIYKEREERAENPDDVPPIERARPLPGVTCPAAENTPCPTGEYRQGSVNELGCYVRSACMPFNTETQPEKKVKDKAVICPAMPTVDSCKASEAKVVAFSSPECGTYYTCKPKPEERTTKFPFTFKSGRTVVSFDEARIYCYESGSRGATARGDKKECLNAFGITVPDIPPEKQCAEYGKDWHTMDGSGNCFNPNMDEYRTPGGTLQRCAVTPVYGCKKIEEPIKPPGEQKEQVWNSLGLRSWIREDASISRISSLKEACATVQKTSNVWLPEAGTSSSADFGMPDPEKCKKAAACAVDQYFNGSECSGETPPKPQCSDAKDNDSDGKIDYPSDTDCSSADDWDEARVGTTGDECSPLMSESSCKTKAECSWVVNSSSYGGYCALTSTMWTPQCSDGKDNDGDGKADYPTDSGCSSKTDDLEQDNVGGESGMRRCFYSDATINGKDPGYSVWCEADYYNCHVGEPAGASVSLSGLALGAPSNCESWGEQSRTTCPAGKYWDGSICKSQEPVVSGSCSSDKKSLLGSGCHSMGNAWFNGSMTLYILPASTMVRSCSSEKISGCGGSHADVSCPASQWWNGSSCVSSEGTICGENEYWDSGKGGCMSSARACSGAGGTWDSTKNYCEMPQPKTQTQTQTTQTTQTNQTGTTVTSGGGGGAGAMYTWNSYGLSSMVREDADPARLASLKLACANVKSSSANVWMPNAGIYSSADFGMPNPDKCAKAASCSDGQYFDGAECSSTSSSGGGSGVSGSTGTSDTIGSECRSQSSQSACSAVSGCYWYTGYSSNYCDSGGSAAPSSGTGSNCGSNEYWDTLTNSCRNSESACAEAGGTWNSSSSYCTMQGSSSGGSGYNSGSSGSSGSSGTTDYSSMQAGCASAGGTWDSATNYCLMSSGDLENSFAYLCPERHLWNGSYCIVTKEGTGSFLANVLQAFLALFGK